MDGVKGGAVVAAEATVCGTAFIFGNVCSPLATRSIRSAGDMAEVEEANSPMNRGVEDEFVRRTSMGSKKRCEDALQGHRTKANLL